MKKIIPVFFFVFLISTAALAQTWTRMQSWGLDFEAIFWINDLQGVSVGERLIVWTADGGQTWNEVLQKFDTRFLDVVFLDSAKGIAVGEKGAIYLTSDGGITWMEKDSGTVNTLRSLTKLSPTQVMAVGDSGQILSSEDAGNTWTAVASGTTRHLNKIVSSNETTLYIAADEGTLLKSVDKGVTWLSSSLDPSLDLLGLVFTGSQIGYVVGESGLFLKTIDGGTTWTKLNSTTTNTLRQVSASALDIRIIIAVGDQATVLRSANSGATFVRANLGATNFRQMKNLAFKPNSAVVAAVGQDGYLINSTNAGASWSQKFAGIRNNFSSVDFKNQNTGFIAGEQGAFFLTTNGATALVSRPIPEPIFIQTIDFWNTAFGYTSSPGGRLYRTGNSGTSWVPVFLPVNRTLSGYYLFAPSVVYAAGNQGYITRSTDSGVTWDQNVKSNTNENLKDLMFFDFVFGFAMGENGHISWSAGGNEWQTLPKVTTQHLNALAKLDTTRAIIVGDAGTILKTDDKARTWRVIQSGTTKKLTSVDFFGENVGFIAGEEGLAMVSLDGGETWLQSPTGTVRDFSGVSAGTDSKAYFVGEDGTVITYTCIPPAGSLGAISGNSQACVANEVYTINENPIQGSAIVWRVDGGEILSGQGTNRIEVNWTIPGRNAVLVSRSNFCGSGETSAMEVAVAAIPPTTTAITGEGTSCQGRSYTYSLPNLEGVSYQWEVTGGEILSGQSSHQVEITWSQVGQQQISVTQTNRCGPAPALIKTVLVNAAPSQPAAIVGEALIGLGEQIYETVNTEGLDYRWTLSGGGKITSGQGTSRIVVNWEMEGNFELSVEAQNQCGYGVKQTRSVVVNIITALEPDPLPVDLLFYPNPSDGQITLQSSKLDSFESIQVINSLGQILYQAEILPGETSHQLFELPRGVHHIRLFGKSGAVSKKILVR